MPWMGNPLAFLNERRVRFADPERGADSALGNVDERGLDFVHVNIAGEPFGKV